VAYVVHYFDRTGDRRTGDAREDAVFPEWTAALRDAVTFARADPAVDTARVGALGVSLGGYMALALGAADARVGRLVVLSGGFFDALEPTVHRLPAPPSSSTARPTTSSPWPAPVACGAPSPGWVCRTRSSSIPAGAIPSTTPRRPTASRALRRS
jgi:dienelactone hydrolase